VDVFEETAADPATDRDVGPNSEVLLPVSVAVAVRAVLPPVTPPTLLKLPLKLPLASAVRVPR
jgi:hypothetical protein